MTLSEAGMTLGTSMRRAAVETNSLRLPGHWPRYAHTYKHTHTHLQRNPSANYFWVHLVWKSLDRNEMSDINTETGQVNKDNSELWFHLFPQNKSALKMLFAPGSNLEDRWKPFLLTVRKEGRSKSYSKFWTNGLYSLSGEDQQLHSDQDSLNIASSQTHFTHGISSARKSSLSCSKWCTLSLWKLLNHVFCIISFIATEIDSSAPCAVQMGPCFKGGMGQTRKRNAGIVVRICSKMLIISVKKTVSGRRQVTPSQTLLARLSDSHTRWSDLPGSCRGQETRTLHPSGAADTTAPLLLTLNT